MLNKEIKTFSQLFILTMLVLSTVTLCLFDLTSFDLWLHMRTGQLVLEQQAFPHTDPFTYTVAGKPWVAHEWLFGVIFYLLNSIGGSILLVITKVLIILATLYLVLTANPAKERNYLLTASLFFAALVFSRFRLLLRPHLFSLLFLALYYYAYIRWRNGEQRMLWVFPITMVFWANIHAGSIFGLVFLALMLIGELARTLYDQNQGNLGGVLFGQKTTPPNPLTKTLIGLSQRETLDKNVKRSNAFIPLKTQESLSRARLITLAVLLAGTVLASLVNPYGYHLLLLPFTLKSMQQIPHLKLIEWVPYSFSEKPFLFTYLMIVSGWVIFRIRRLTGPQILCYGFYAFLMLSARRGVPYWGFLAIPIIEASFYNPADRNRTPPGWGQFSYAQIAGLTMVIISMTIAFSPDPVFRVGLGVREDKLPGKTVEYIQQNGIRGRMFNSYRFGGYLIWRLFDSQRVFFDGRASLFRDIFRYRSQYTTEQLIDYFNADYLVVDYQKDLPFSLEMEPDQRKWALVFWDDAARLYLKRIPRFSGLIARDEYLIVKPTDKAMDFLSKQNKITLIEEEIRRAVSVSPYNFRAQLFQSALLYTLDKKTEAEELFKQTIKRKPDNNVAYFTMAALLKRLNHNETALEYLKLAMKKGFKDWTAYELLGNIYAGLQDYQQAIKSYQKGLEVTDNFRLNYFLGYTYLLEKQYQLAERHLVKAYSYDPNNNRTWQPLARIYTYKGEYEKAREFEMLIQRQVQHQDKPVRAEKH